MKRIPESNWEWHAYAGHLIVGAMCQFHLCTTIGCHMISTVGDYFPDGPRGERKTIGAGHDSFFETYVFKWSGARCKCGCGLPRPDDWSEIEGERTPTAKAARECHMRTCEKYATVSQAPAPGGEIEDRAPVTEG